MPNVTYDHRAIKIDGKRTLLLSGSFHYPRSTPGMWRYLMKMFRDANLNAVETYVFWNLHERRKGEYDFTGRLDIKRWCEMAQDEGLYIILRIGPYICAETNYGGFPFWLRDIPGIRMRTYNKPFLHEMERWVRYLCEYLKPYFAPQGGTIILFQLESEYDMIKGNYGLDGETYIRWCAELGESLNLGIPLIMCSGAAPGAIETTNAFEAHDKIKDFATYHPDKPVLWTENWTGWYDIYGYPRHRRSAENLSYSTARFIAGGGSMVNYYPFFGGTNFAREGMYLLTSSYDYDAPLNEEGFPTRKYCHLTKLHYFLRKYEEIILSTENPYLEQIGNQKFAFIYRDEDQNLVFLCNDSLSDSLVNYESQNYILGAKSVMMIGNGRVIMHTADLSYSCAKWRDVAHKETQPLEMLWRNEPLPHKWSDLHKSRITASHPEEQLQYTRDETDYCWYSIDFRISPEHAGNGKIVIEGAADVVHVFVDDIYRGSAHAPLLEDRGSLDGEGFKHTIDMELDAGEHHLEILCCALGLIKGDWQIGFANMAEEKKGIWGRALWNEVEIKGAWDIQPGLAGEKDELYSEVGTAFNWESNWKNAVHRPLTWWRTEFDRPSGDDPLVIDLSGMQKGMIWLNGQCLGRYWLILAQEQKAFPSEVPIELVGLDQPTQRYYHLPFDWIKEKENHLVLFEEMGGDPSKVRICRKIWVDSCNKGMTGKKT
ncbi:beta-galactosidase [Candidatus Sumerlaeota bacterium]|nr:beta-galactosidase [Candidatus Sumerlaeota bacterium]